MRVLLLSLALLLVACEGEQTQAVVPPSAQQVTLAVSKMTCSTCGPTVRKALQAVPGVYKAVVDVEGGTATVYYDPALADSEALAKATTNAGYPSKVM